MGTDIYKLPPACTRGTWPCRACGHSILLSAAPCSAHTGGPTGHVDAGPPSPPRSSWSQALAPIPLSSREPSQQGSLHPLSTPAMPVPHGFPGQCRACSQPPPPPQSPGTLQSGSGHPVEEAVLIQPDTSTSPRGGLSLLCSCCCLQSQPHFPCLWHTSICAGPRICKLPLCHHHFSLLPFS